MASSATGTWPITRSTASSRCSEHSRAGRIGRVYPVDPALLRVRAPKVAQKEVETYSTEQIERIFAATSSGWPTIAVKVLLSTGMRLSELCGLTVEDFEEDGLSAFLKVKHGKGAKFRRVPVSSRLRRDLMRYVNRWRPESRHSNLLLRADGEPVSIVAVAELFRRIRARVDFGVRAHRFRHTFATEYLCQGGEIERLRRIQGHTTYVMVMRYVHWTRATWAGTSTSGPRFERENNDDRIRDPARHRTGCLPTGRPCPVTSRLAGRTTVWKGMVVAGVAVLGALGGGCSGTRPCGRWPWSVAWLSGRPLCGHCVPSSPPWLP